MNWLALLCVCTHVYVLVCVCGGVFQYYNIFICTLLSGLDVFLFLLNCLDQVL